LKNKGKAKVSIRAYVANFLWLLTLQSFPTKEVGRRKM
jgi:hypothetical protein